MDVRLRSKRYDRAFVSERWGTLGGYGTNDQTLLRKTTRRSVSPQAVKIIGSHANDMKRVRGPYRENRHLVIGCRPAAF